MARCTDALLDPVHQYATKKALIKIGGDIHAKGRNGETALHLAVKNLDSAFIEYLLEKESRVSAVDAQGRTPIFYLPLESTSPKFRKVVKLLLAQKIYLDVRNAEGETLLHLAVALAKYKGIWLVKQLLDKNADLNVRNAKGQTPLHYACRDDNQDMVRVLLAAGADPNIPDKKGKTPILLLERSRYNMLIPILLRYNANVNVIDKFGRHLLLGLNKNMIEMFLIHLTKEQEKGCHIEPAIAKFVATINNSGVIMDRCTKELRKMKKRIVHKTNTFYFDLLVGDEEFIMEYANEDLLNYLRKIDVCSQFVIYAFYVYHRVQNCVLRLKKKDK